jgi:hypothetical protein
MLVVLDPRTGLLIWSHVGPLDKPEFLEKGEFTYSLDRVLTRRS